ncbi:MAG: DpnI domain-containing protein [Phenylobacterium sp.]
MATARQDLGVYGERLVAKLCACPRCKRPRSLVPLPTNFKCADLICDFCGYLGQVKATTVRDAALLPRTILGAAWGPQRDRMASGIYFPLFLVLRSPTAAAVYYLAADLQTPDMFKERAPLSASARRAGWQGFLYDLTSVRDRFVRLTPEDIPVAAPGRAPRATFSLG